MSPDSHMKMLSNKNAVKKSEKIILYGKIRKRSKNKTLKKNLSKEVPINWVQVVFASAEETDRKWNVTPLLGHFGGIVEFCGIL